MNLFYSDDLFNKDQILSIDESRHCLSSLRQNIGDKILITDGKGKIYSTQIKSIKNKQVVYSDLKLKASNNKNISIHIAIAPTKNKTRFEWFLEKATEIGIDTISPIICDNSERKNINQTRCDKVVISAMKQSKNCILPKINPLISFKEFIKKNPKNTYIAHCYKSKKIDFQNIVTKKNIKDITIMIGPEGDFSKQEIELSDKMKYKALSLSQNRLRTETAGIFVCSMLQLLQ